MDTLLEFEAFGAQRLKDVVFDSTAGEFVLIAGESSELTCRISYSFGVGEIDPADAFVAVLSHPSHAESDVRKVRLTGKEATVGWLCTIGALVSLDHDYVESPHFRRAAFAASHALLAGGGYSIWPKVADGGLANLSDFFDLGLSVLILHRPSLGGLVDDNCSEILPSLHGYGFLPLSNKSPDVADLSNVSGGRFSEGGDGLVLSPVSTEVGFAQFTTQVFRQLLPTANTPLLRFFLYYQIIELLMARVFAHKQSATIEALQSVKDDPIKAHPLIKKLNSNADEKKRIRLVFNEYTASAAATEDLRLRCNDFLRQCDAEEKDHASEALYQVRNIVYHSMRAIPEKAFQAFDSVVNELACVVPDLLVAFRLPPRPDSGVADGAASEIST